MIRKEINEFWKKIILEFWQRSLATNIGKLKQLVGSYEPAHESAEELALRLV